MLEEYKEKTKLLENTKKDYENLMKTLNENTFDIYVLSKLLGIVSNLFTLLFICFFSIPFLTIDNILILGVSFCIIHCVYQYYKDYKDKEESLILKENYPLISYYDIFSFFRGCLFVFSLLSLPILLFVEEKGEISMIVLIVMTSIVIVYITFHIFPLINAFKISSRIGFSNVRKSFNKKEALKKAEKEILKTNPIRRKMDAYIKDINSLINKISNSDTEIVNVVKEGRKKIKDYDTILRKYKHNKYIMDNNEFAKNILEKENKNENAIYLENL